VEQKDYDEKSVDAIYAHALKLTGKSLAEARKLPEDVTNVRNRGNLGTLIEEFYFGLKPNSIHAPDFPEAGESGLELKTTGVTKDSRKGFRAKERLVLTMVDYNSIVSETWETSSLLMKCRLMLILFYLFEEGVSVLNRKFVLEPMLFDMLKNDAAVIRRDWELIQQKIRDGRAHELSEGDTYYLGVCRKGAGGENEKLRNQPFSEHDAKARAFAFRQGYLTKLIDGHSSGASSLGVSAELSFEQATQLRFQPYIGRTVAEISAALNYFKKSPNHKSFNSNLAKRILSEGEGEVLELAKAEIEMKTVRIPDSGTPEQHMSFPGFKFMELVDQDWEDSSFFERLERRFLFVVFKVEDSGIERLEKVAYWNMPYLDRMEAKRVWEETKRRVSLDASKLPGAKESPIAHVRPKGKNGGDKIMTPQGTLAGRQCFWLNREYIGKVVSGL
jgi:DNA mismatch repair protein MutH